MLEQHSELKKEVKRLNRRCKKQLRKEKNQSRKHQTGIRTFIEYIFSFSICCMDLFVAFNLCYQPLLFTQRNTVHTNFHAVKDMGCVVSTFIEQ